MKSSKSTKRGNKEGILFVELRWSTVHSHNQHLPFSDPPVIPSHVVQKTQEVLKKIKQDVRGANLSHAVDISQLTTKRSVLAFSVQTFGKS